MAQAKNFWEVNSILNSIWCLLQFLSYHKKKASLKNQARSLKPSNFKFRLMPKRCMTGSTRTILEDWACLSKKRIHSLFHQTKSKGNLKSTCISKRVLCSMLHLNCKSQYHTLFLHYQHMINSPKLASK